MKLEVIQQVIQKTKGLDNSNGFSTLSFETVNIDLIKLMDFINNTPLCYFKSKDNDIEFLGIGTCANFPESKKDKVEEILDLNPNLRFFTSLNFNSSRESSPEWKSFNDYSFILPTLCWIKENGKCFLEVNFPNSIRENPNHLAEYTLSLEEYLTLFNVPVSLTGNISVSDILDIPQKEIWNESINACLETLECSSLNKIVLARKKVLNLSSFNPVNYFQKLTDKTENSYLFFLKINEDNAFFSLSPERLFKKNRNLIIIDSIAGTRTRGATLSEDLLLERELKSSKKELAEHRLVSREIHNLLVEICEDISTPVLEGILKQKYVQHLQTIFTGKLNAAYSIFEIINKIHPTPAVGGLPKGAAQDLINKLENFDRGLYAGPIGLISKDSAELAVGIRSALLNGEKLHVFGGAGIILGSTAEKEWDETFNKMRNFLE